MDPLTALVPQVTLWILGLLRFSKSGAGNFQIQDGGALFEAPVYVTKNIFVNADQVSGSSFITHEGTATVLTSKGGAVRYKSCQFSALCCDITPLQTGFAYDSDNSATASSLSVSSGVTTLAAESSTVTSNGQVFFNHF